MAKQTQTKPNGAPPADMPDWAKDESSTQVAVLERSSEEALTETVSDELFREDASDGSEFGKEDLAIPFLRALQDGSPQVKTREPLYISGATAGMFFNTVTGRIWPESETQGLIMIPVAYTPSFTEWKPDRKGFAADHGSNADIMKQTRKGGKDGKEDVLPNGNTISRAGLYYVFVYDEVTGAITEAAFSLSSTGLTISRKWNTQIREVRAHDPKGSYNPASFYMAYRVKTFLDTTKTAGDFFSYLITPYKKTVELGPNGPSIYRAAKQFKKLVAEGAVKVKQEQAEGPSDANEDTF